MLQRDFCQTKKNSLTRCTGGKAGPSPIMRQQKISGCFSGYVSLESYRNICLQMGYNLLNVHLVILVKHFKHFTEASCFFPNIKKKCLINVY